MLVPEEHPQSLGRVRPTTDVTFGTLDTSNVSTYEARQRQHLGVEINIRVVSVVKIHQIHSLGIQSEC